MLKIQLSILLIFTTVIGYAQNSGIIQNSSIKHFTIDDGLPSNIVFGILFDSKGYLWIGTDKGIARFNGIEFKIFNINDGLPDNEIFAFSEDRENRIWITNFKGELCYYKDNVFHTAANTPWLKLDDKTPANLLDYFRLLPDSSIVTSTVNCSMLVVIKHNTIRKIPIGKLSSNFATVPERTPILITRPDSKHFEIFYHYKSLLIDEQANVIKTTYYKDKAFRYRINSSRQTFIGSVDTVFTAEGKIIGFVPLHDTAKTSLLNPPSKYIYIQDDTTIYWTSKNGLFCNNQPQILNQHFTVIDHDPFGNIWAGTVDNGLFCISKNFNSSYQYAGHFNNIVTSSLNDDKLHIVTEAGKVYNLFHNLTNAAPIAKLNLNYQLLKPYNTFITPKGDVLNVQASRIYYKNASKNNINSIEVLLDDKTDYNPSYKSFNVVGTAFYASTVVSVLKIEESDLRSKKKVTFSDLAIYSQNTYNRIYSSSVLRKDTSIWFSKTGAIFRIKNGNLTEQKKLRQYTFRQFAFFKSYFVGISDKYKLYIYNTASEVLDSVRDSNSVWETLYNINDSTAVVNTDNSYKLLKLYAPLKTGKPSYAISTIENPFLPKHADYILGDGKFYYFLKNGVLSGFPSAMITAKPLPPTPIFVSVKTVKKNYAASSDVALPYSESKTITIEIDNVSFNDKEVVTQYSISKDNNDNWITITGNEINLNAIGMGYGKYTIKLRSKTRASDFSNPAVLILHIATPFWAQWWFIALCVIAFILLALAVIRIIIWRQVRKRQKEFDSEMKYQQSEYKALNALMNPHFIFNSLNNIQGLINKDLKETANQYLVIFSKLIRQNMHNVSKGYISLYQEMILIENYLYLEKLRFKDLINFTIEIGEEIDTETIMIPPLLIQPIVENAIIHGLLPMQSEKSKVNIRIFEVDDVIHIEVEDNGVGLNQSLKKKNANSDSYGLSNLHRRIEHVKKFQKSNIEFGIKELVDDNGNTLGTKASITIAEL